MEIKDLDEYVKIRGHEKALKDCTDYETFYTVWLSISEMVKSVNDVEMMKAVMTLQPLIISTLTTIKELREKVTQ